MTDILIPLGKSNINHLELKYALRSVEKHLSNVGDVYIAGEKPKWLKNVKVLPVRDELQSRWKERNIYRKVVAGCKSTNLSETFLFMNDDHFLLSDFDAGEFPYYHKGELRAAMAKNSGNYRKTLNHTRKLLEAEKLTTENYDIHTPCNFKKTTFLCTFEHTDWAVPYGYGLKSLYCVKNGVNGEYMKDCKIDNMDKADILRKIEGRTVFSTGSINRHMVEVFEELYPQKSKYEQ